MDKKDRVFGKDGEGPIPFEFNETVAICFDDMVKRSVPLYLESIRLQCELAKRFYDKNTYIYDLGCSTGNFGISFLEIFGNLDFKMNGFDNSKPMISIYERRLSSRNNNERIKAFCKDINDVKLENASVVVMNLTLQFIKKDKRDELVKRIYDGLNPGGIFLLTEKVSNDDDIFESIGQNIYYDFKKKNGYSELEINKKREALDNVLQPESALTHIERFKKTGFKIIDVYLKWFQFSSFIARKEK